MEETISKRSSDYVSVASVILLTSIVYFLFLTHFCITESDKHGSPKSPLGKSSIDPRLLGWNLLGTPTVDILVDQTMVES